MLLALLLSALGKKDSNTPIETQFLEKFSLMHPHVSENGKSDYYIYSGQYFIKTGTRSDYSQLGYDHPNTSATLQMRDPLKHKNFKFEVEFSFNTSNAGNCCGFWISEALNSGEYYGRNTNFQGVGVVLDTRGGNPFAKFVDSTNPKASKQVDIRYSDKISVLTFENIGSKLTVKMFIEGTEYLLYSGESNVSPTYYFGASAITGQTPSPLRINSITGFTVTKQKSIYVKGETKKSSKIILVIGICSILGLVYYLYQKQRDDFLKKQ